MSENLDAGNTQPDELSPGKMLLQGRLQAGLTQEQVAKDLYMTVYKVKALETDDYKRLNSDTFARGYIRAYANLVKVDVVAVLAAYDKLMDELRPQPVEQQHLAATENSPRGAWQFLAVIGAFFVGLWLISVWFFDNHSESQYVVAPDNLTPVVTTAVKASTDSSSNAVNEASQSSEASKANQASDISKVNKVNEINKASSEKSSAVSSSSVAANVKTNSAKLMAMANASSTKSSSQGSVQSAGSTSSQSMNSASAATQGSAASVKKTKLDELSFSFRGESWLEVSDSRGDVLATELEPAGSNIKLAGIAPFDVKLGNAPAVDVQLNGKKIDVIPLMGSNVLIMKIGN